MTAAELRSLYAAKVAPLGSCTCGLERRPERRRVGALAVLVCGRCGKRTTERKGA